MILTVHTYVGGEIMSGIFNAVAAFFQDHSLLNAILSVTLIGGGMGAMLMGYFKQDSLFPYKWAAITLGLYTAFFVPKIPVSIHDHIQGHLYRLDNVPAGLAVLSSVTTTIGFKVTETLEAILRSPEDMKYGNTGMMFGSRIMEDIEDAQIENPDILANMEGFADQCIKYDITLNNKYSYQELKESNNIWRLIANKSSPVRQTRIYDLKTKKTRYMSCKDAAPILEDQLKDAVGDVARRGSLTFFGKDDTVDLANYFLDTSTSVWRFFTGLREDASIVLRNNLVKNAIKSGAKRYAAATGASLGDSFAVAKAWGHQQSASLVMFDMVARSLPILMTTLQALLYVAFIFLLPLSLLPNGIGKIGSYAGVLLWLQSWPVVFAVINFCMTMAAAASTKSMVHGGMIANMGAVSDINATFVVVGQLLASLIPFLSISLIKFDLGSFSHLAGAMTSPMQGAAGAAASEQISGNYSYGNVSLENDSYGNMSSGKRDQGASFKGAGLMERWVQSPTSGATGALQKFGADTGSYAIEGGAGRTESQGSSQYTTDTNIRQAETQGLQQAKSQMEQAGLSLHENASNGNRQAKAIHEAIMEKEGIGEDVHERSSIAARESTRNQVAAFEKWADAKGLTEDERAGVSKYGKLGFEVAGLGGGGSLDSGASISKSKSESLMNEFMTSDEYVKAFEQDMSYASGKMASRGIDQTKTASDDLSQHFEKVKSSAKNWSTLDEARESFTSSIDAMKQEGGSVMKNRRQGIEKSLRDMGYSHLDAWKTVDEKDMSDQKYQELRTAIAENMPSFEQHKASVMEKANNKFHKEGPYIASKKDTAKKMFQDQQRSLGEKAIDEKWKKYDDKQVPNWKKRFDKEDARLMGSRTAEKNTVKLLETMMVRLRNNKKAHQN